MKREKINLVGTFRVQIKKRNLGMDYREMNEMSIFGLKVKPMASREQRNKYQGDKDPR